MTIFSDKEVRFLTTLHQEGVEFIVVGLSAATLQGAPVVTQDIDLWFKDLNDSKIELIARKCGGAYVPSVAFNPPMFAGGGLALFDIVLNMHGLGSFDEETKNTVELDLNGEKIKVLKLERIIVSKEAVNRNKDKLVLPVLRDALRIIQDK